MRRVPILSLTSVLVLAACGGGDSAQEQTEEAAVEATVNAMRGTMRGNADAVLGFLTEECRAGVDKQEIELAMLFVRGLMESDDGVDLDDIEVIGTIDDFDGDTATVDIEYVAPEGADLDGLFFGDTEVDVVYENNRWVGADCEFGETDSSSSDANLDADLEALGLVGTQDDPIPLGTAAPIGGGFEIVFTAWDTDAVERYNTAEDTNLLLDEGENLSVLEFQVRYTDDEEPKGLSDVQIELVGSDAVGVNEIGCGAIAPDLSFTSRSIFTGGVFTGAACFSATPARFDGAVVSVAGDFFQDRTVFFDPATEAASIETLTGTAGPSPDGDATDDRTAPVAAGTEIELDDDWTVTVNGFEADATEALLAESSFADDPRPDAQFALLDVSMTYTGDESASPFFVSVGLVGDSNVSADDCSFISAPDELDRGAELFNGGTVTGTICFQIDAADADSMVAWFRSSSGFDADPVFAAVS